MAGRGSALTRAAVSLGIRLTLVRSWIGDRNLERSLKNRKNSKGLCPNCKAELNNRSKLAMRKKRSK